MQDETIRLETYEQWKCCITDVCGIALTASYVEARIAALRNPHDHETHRFIASWGEPHRQRVITWFLQARQELKC